MTVPKQPEDTLLRRAPSDSRHRDERPAHHQPRDDANPLDGDAPAATDSTEVSD